MAYLLGVFFFVCAGLAGVEHIIIAALCVVIGGWFFTKATPGGLETILSFMFAFIVLGLGFVFLRNLFNVMW